MKRSLPANVTVDRRKQPESRWLQDPKQINGFKAITVTLAEGVREQTAEEYWL